MYRVYRPRHEHHGRHHLHLHQALGGQAQGPAEVPGEWSRHSRTVGKEKQQTTVSDILRGRGQEPDNLMERKFNYAAIYDEVYLLVSLSFLFFICYRYIQ